MHLRDIPRYRNVIACATMMALCATGCGSWQSLSESATATAGAEEPAETSDPTERVSQQGEVISAAEIQVAPIAETAPPTTSTTTTTTTSTTSTIARPHLVGDTIAAPGQQSIWVGSFGRGENAAPISLRLAENGEFVRGEITYHANDKSRQVAGRRYPEGSGWFLREFSSSGRVVHSWIIDSLDDGVISSASRSNRPIELVLDSVEDSPNRFPTNVVLGTFRFEFGPFGDDDACCGPQGSITITPDSDTTISLTAEGVTGGPAFNMARLDADGLVLDGNVAHYEVRDDWLDCAIDFVVFDDLVFADYVGDRFECGFGHNASVSGIYLSVQ